MWWSSTPALSWQHSSAWWTMRQETLRWSRWSVSYTISGYRYIYFFFFLCHSAFLPISGVAHWELGAGWGESQNIWTVLWWGLLPDTVHVQKSSSAAVHPLHVAGQYITYLTVYLNMWLAVKSSNSGMVRWHLHGRSLTQTTSVTFPDSMSTRVVSCSGSYWIVQLMR